MTEADIDRVMAIAASLPTAPHWASSVYEAAISSHGEPERMARVAMRSGELIGFAIMRLLAPESELESIAIEPEAQGGGFGRLLLAAILQELKLGKIEQVDLEVRASNQAALRLYRQCGFYEVGQRRSYYADPVEDALLLRLRLAE
jgi:ribosomal-protein-alanine N-acetyltransferase